MARCHAYSGPSFLFQKNEILIEKPLEKVLNGKFV